MSEKILIVGPAWVGDMVMAQSLFKTLKQQNPYCTIEVLAPAWSAPLLARMPEVQASHVMPVGHGKLDLKTRYLLGRSLRKERFDQAILLPNSWKSALVPFWAKIPLRTGWRGEMRFGLLNDTRKLNKKDYPRMVERFVALAYPNRVLLPKNIPLPALILIPEEIEKAKAKFSLTTNEQAPILALCPGAEFGKAKRWPEKHYATLANEKLQQGWQVWIFGSPKDVEVAKTIQAATQNKCQDLTGRTTLAQAIDLLSLASVVVSNDSGLMHIAASLKKPVVALYGPTDPTFAPPLSARAKSLHLGLSCSPCRKRECPLQHQACLETLLPPQVLTAVEEVIS